MKFHLTIDCDNDAFEYKTFDGRDAEIARILRGAATHVKDYGPNSGPLRDRNGNRVGHYYMEETP